MSLAIISPYKDTVEPHQIRRPFILLPFLLQTHYRYSVLLMQNQKIAMDHLMLQELFKYSDSREKTRTYIIKKEHLDLQPQKYVLPQSERKIYSFRIQGRSKSQNRTQSKEKINSQQQNFKFQKHPAPPKRDILRVRSLKSGRDGLRKPYKSVEENVKTMSPRKSRDRENSKVSCNMESYLEFILAPKDVQYVVQADFQSLRRRGRKYGITKAEKKVFGLLQNIFQTLYQTLSTSESGVSEVIEENCLLYLQCHEKAKIQILLSLHYPKLLHSKLRPYLIYQRQLIYLVCLFNRNTLLDKMSLPQRESLKILIRYTEECLQILLEPLLRIEKEVVSQINQTFSILKAIGQMEKRLVVIEKEIVRIYGRVSKELMEIERSFYELVKAKYQWPLEQLVNKQMELSWKYLKIPPLPFLPPTQKPYTLVLQLNYTLIFYDKDTKMLKYRPYIDIFLTKLKESFEIVVYTTASHEYSQVIIKQIQKVGRYFDYCLCEGHLVMEEGKTVKDYGRIGRDPKKMVIVDHARPEGKKFRSNFFEVSEWNGDKSDRSLYKLTNVLWELQLTRVDDVRAYLREVDSALQMISQDEEEGEKQ